MILPICLCTANRANDGGSLRYCSTVEETGCQVRCAHCAIIAVIIIKTPATSYVKTMICSAYFFKPLTLGVCNACKLPPKTDGQQLQLDTI